jgi:hypothetical protein
VVGTVVGAACIVGATLLVLPPLRWRGTQRQVHRVPFVEIELVDVAVTIADVDQPVCLVDGNDQEEFMVGAVDIPLTFARLCLAHTPPPAGRDPPYRQYNAQPAERVASNQFRVRLRCSPAPGGLLAVGHYPAPR